jgi:hypothetical protein
LIIASIERSFSTTVQTQHPKRLVPLGSNGFALRGRWLLAFVYNVSSTNKVTTSSALPPRIGK